MLAQLRPREPRTSVLVPCRLNHGSHWIDGCVHNVSSRGMLLAADDAPDTGAYIDIRRGTLVIIARVMWRKGRFFGVRTQDRIDVSTLVNEPRRNRPPVADGTPAERRSTARLAAEGRAARRAEDSQRWAARLQFVLIVGAGTAMALLAADYVYDLLVRPADAIGAAMRG